MTEHLLHIVLDGTHDLNYSLLNPILSRRRLQFPFKWVNYVLILNAIARKTSIVYLK